MPKKLTTKEFIERSAEKHNNRYDYFKTEYINTRTKVIVICKEHGEFIISPDNHLGQGQGCVKCSQEKHKLTTISNDKLIKFKEIHNNKYSYIDLSVNDGMISIICPTHGKFTQSIYNHVYGHGCYECEKELRVKVRTKVCISCKIDKNLSEYDLKYQTCKSCIESKLIPETKICSKCNLKKNINEFHNRKDSFDTKRNECNMCFNIEFVKPYKQRNKVSLRKKDLEYRKKRMQTDPLYRAKIDARNIIRKSLGERGYSKKARTFEILGCSYEKFKDHIELQFTEGMGWENRNMWHIDHIIPLSFAKDEKELLMVNHYSNLRPLCGTENETKSNTIEIINDIYYKILENRNSNYANSASQSSNI